MHLRMLLGRDQNACKHPTYLEKRCQYNERSQNSGQFSIGREWVEGVVPVGRGGGPGV